MMLILFFCINFTSGKSFSQEPFMLKTDTEDISLTDDVQTAKAQVNKYPDNPEAHFNLAIALSKTSAVEEAIEEFHITKKMILNKGDIGIIDKKISEYSQMLKDDPNAHNIRYRLAFSHYLKAYFISKEKFKKEKAEKKQQIKKLKKEGKMDEALALEKQMEEEKKIHTNIFDSDKAKTDDSNPEVSLNLQKSVDYFKENVQKNPTDPWTKIYYGFVLAEQYNDFDSAKKLWYEVKTQYPNNPAPYFFIGESLLKDGKLKEGLTEIAQAVLLRSAGN